MKVCIKIWPKTKHSHCKSSSHSYFVCHLILNVATLKFSANTTVAQVFLEVLCKGLPNRPLRIRENYCVYVERSPSYTGASLYFCDWIRPLQTVFPKADIFQEWKLYLIGDRENFIFTRDPLTHDVQVVTNIGLWRGHWILVKGKFTFLIMTGSLKTNIFRYSWKTKILLSK